MSTIHTKCENTFNVPIFICFLAFNNVYWIWIIKCFFYLTIFSFCFFLVTLRFYSMYSIMLENFPLLCSLAVVLLWGPGVKYQQQTFTTTAFTPSFIQLLDLKFAYSKEQSWARDITAATTWPCFQATKLFFMQYYYICCGYSI